MQYVWQQPNWPNFIFDKDKLNPLANTINRLIGRLEGLVFGLNQAEKDAALLDALVWEALKTNEIEGENLSRLNVWSSVRQQLGIRPEANFKGDLRSQGIAELLINIRDTFETPLTQEDLFQWHGLLFPKPTSFSVGAYRSSSAPMQIISGNWNEAQIHFEAVPGVRVQKEMNQFIHWFNSRPQGVLVFSGLCHLYFESIHPFEDGNGRIGRALAEKAIFISSGKHFIFSLSKAIEKKRDLYYDSLKKGQRTLDATDWLLYWGALMEEALLLSEEVILASFTKRNFFLKYEQLNARQEKALRKMFETYPEPFDGGMTAKKYMGINRTSKATATRDLTQLEAMGAIRRIGSGRAVRYELLT